MNYAKSEKEFLVDYEAHPLLLRRADDNGAPLEGNKKYEKGGFYFSFKSLLLLHAGAACSLCCIRDRPRDLSSEREKERKFSFELCRQSEILMGSVNISCIQITPGGSLHNNKFIFFFILL